MQPFFELNEDFESIIRNTLSKKEGIVDIVKISPITTGWTNIVYRVETIKHNYFFINNVNFSLYFRFLIKT